MQRALLIYNPTSGGQAVPSRLDEIVARFQAANILLQPYRVDGDEKRLLRTLKQNYDFAIFSGGDGTLHHLANIFLKHEITIPIGIIPAGTSNDFARCLDIPGDLDQCLEIILKGRIQAVDALLVNGKQYALSTCAGGLFVDIAYSTDSDLKRSFGPLAYYLQALNQLTDIRPFTLKLETEKESLEERVLLFLILNGKHGAGFSHLAGEADLSDGIMDIILIRDCTHIDLASLFFRVMNNELLNDANVISLRAKECKLSAENNIPVTLDGEEGRAFPHTIECKHKALKVFAP